MHQTALTSYLHFIPDIISAPNFRHHFRNLNSTPLSYPLLQPAPVLSIKMPCLLTDCEHGDIVEMMYLIFDIHRHKNGGIFRSTVFIYRRNPRIYVVYIT